MAGKKAAALSNNFILNRDRVSRASISPNPRARAPNIRRPTLGLFGARSFPPILPRVKPTLALNQILTHLYIVLSAILRVFYLRSFDSPAIISVCRAKLPIISIGEIRNRIETLIYRN